MAALLVALAIMAVMMSVALPVWRHDAQREKEEELVFRGQQYIRAIRLFQTRNRTFPASVDMLVQGRFLRKKFKDPITNDDFTPIPAAGAMPGQGGQPGAGRSGAPTPGNRSGMPASGISPGQTGLSGSPFSGSSAMIPGGMMGVVSKSKDESIRLYQGRNHYNEWAFIFVNQQPGGPGGPGRGGPGGRGVGPDGRPIRSPSPTGTPSPIGSPSPFGTPPPFGTLPPSGARPGGGRTTGTATIPGGSRGRQNQ